MAKLRNYHSKTKRPRKPFSDRNCTYASGWTSHGKMSLAIHDGKRRVRVLSAWNALDNKLSLCYVPRLSISPPILLCLENLVYRGDPQRRGGYSTGELKCLLCRQFNPMPPTVLYLIRGKNMLTYLPPTATISDKTSNGMEMNCLVPRPKWCVRRRHPLHMLFICGPGQRGYSR